jgi:hypothetical protein
MSDDDRMSCPKCGGLFVAPWTLDCAARRGVPPPAPVVYINHYRCPNPDCKNEWSVERAALKRAEPAATR